MAHLISVETLEARKWIIVGVVAGILAFCLGWGLLGRTRTSSYANDVKKIESETNKTIDQIHKDFTLLETDATVASKLLPKFDDSEKSLDKAVEKLDSIEPPVQAEEYHKNLTSFYIKSSIFCADLESVCQYIQRRDALLKELSAALDDFDSSSGSAHGDTGVIYAGKRLKTVSDEILGELTYLNKPKALIDSSAALNESISSFGAQANELEQGNIAQDSARVRAAAAGMRNVLVSGLSTRLLEGDKVGIKSYRGREQEIVSLKEKLREEKSEL